jgi:peptidyl-tRNA hydrolase
MKLTVITRADLNPGQQAVQAMHAQRAFVEAHPAVEKLWFEQSNTLALLVVPNEQALCRVLRKAEDRGIRIAIFREPDIDDQLTAIVLEPSPEVRRLCRDLPLALRDP